jgi:hypothetical protein
VYHQQRRCDMTHALNLVLPVKQDAETMAKLKDLAGRFESEIQPRIEEALRKSHIVHFARVLAIGTSYVCVFTEYEGDHREYTEFFRRELTPVFAAIFALADGAPGADDPAAFWDYARKHNVQSLGRSTSGSTTFDGGPAGWLFSAYDGRDVVTIQKALGMPTTD